MHIQKLSSFLVKLASRELNLSDPIPGATVKLREVSREIQEGTTVEIAVEVAIAIQTVDVADIVLEVAAAVVVVVLFDGVREVAEMAVVKIEIRLEEIFVILPVFAVEVEVEVEIAVEILVVAPVAKVKRADHHLPRDSVDNVMNCDGLKVFVVRS